MNRDQSQTTHVLHAIETTRSIRRFLPDPVPAEVISELIRLASCAPSGGNQQMVRYVAVTDPEMRRKVGDVYKEAWDEYSPPSRLAAITDPRERRRVESAFHLGATMGTEPPLLIVVCASRRPGEERPAGASAYPAVQNMLLAARAYGLAGCLTTVHLGREAKLKTILGIPDDVDTYAIVVLGYPRDPQGPVRRRPVGDIAFRDRWSEPLTV